MHKIISLICLLFPLLVLAAESEKPADALMNIRSDAPDRHVVVKGDTLWDISNKFFQDPWKWPHIWGINRETIKNPHWIYPGDVIYLDRRNGTLHIGQAEAHGGAAAEQTKGSGAAEEVEAGGVVRLSPKAQIYPSSHDAIPSIPANVIAPFLTQPLVVEADELENAPALIGAREGRVTLAKEDIAFAKQLPADKGYKWQIYRPGKTLIDPDTQEALGVEAIYLGKAEVQNFAKVSTVAITHSVQEIFAGDRLVLPAVEEFNNYLPRAPESNISARVISIYGGVAQSGKDSIITLNKGLRDGLANGHVLALYRKGEVIWNKDERYKLPDERYGLAFVFRVFNKVSYALVMQAHLPVQLLDRANTP